MRTQMVRCAVSFSDCHKVVTCKSICSCMAQPAAVSASAAALELIAADLQQSAAFACTLLTFAQTNTMNEGPHAVLP